MNTYNYVKIRCKKWKLENLDEPNIGTHQTQTSSMIFWNEVRANLRLGADESMTDYKHQAPYKVISSFTSRFEFTNETEFLRILIQESETRGLDASHQVQILIC